MVGRRVKRLMAETETEIGSGGGEEEEENEERYSYTRNDKVSWEGKVWIYKRSHTGVGEKRARRSGIECRS